MSRGLFLIWLLIPASTSLTFATTHTLRPGDSIQEAIESAMPGDTIILENGVFHGTLQITKPVTIKAKNGGEATVTNRFSGTLNWIPDKSGNQNWYAESIDWPVNWLLVNGIHAFDYRTKENFDKRECGPYWSKGWQRGKQSYTAPPLYFTHDADTNRVWLHMDDDRNPNHLTIDFNSSDLDGQTLVQKDLGTGWNQQDIVVVSQNPPVYPVIMWYGGTREHPDFARLMNIPKICGNVINIQSDDVHLEGLRIHLAPTVGIEVNNSKNVSIQDCYFSGYQYAINTGYECERLTVTHCEFDGGRLLTYGNHADFNLIMWNHSTYVNPIKFNGVGLKFHHNYVYEGFDLFHPRGRHKDFSHVPNLRSDVAYNIWTAGIDNAIEFDGVEALMNLRFHHNLVINQHDALAITTTENGGPLTIDHNLWWGGANRIMKLVGTMRTNRTVHFVHNTYFTGPVASANVFENSAFENNIVLSDCEVKDSWSIETLRSFFPTRQNLLHNGHRYAKDFAGITSDPKLGSGPDTVFQLQKDSPAIDAGVANEAYYQDNVTDGNPDLGALEYGQTIEDWRREFGHCGPRWITAENAPIKAPHRTPWPKDLDRRWGGLD